MTDDPIDATARLLTGEGRGAIAVVLVRGDGAVSAVDRLFRPAGGIPLRASPPNRPRFGRFGPGPGEEVVAMILPGRPPSVEVHGHGGFMASRRVLDLLAEQGVRIADPRPATRSDQARELLGRAPTLASARVLIDQADGALDRAMARIDRDLIDDPSQARAEIDALLGRSSLGLRLISGFLVALVGRPNVGKSRLLNAIAGFDRSVVSPSAGTTRDLVTAHLAVSGWPVAICDTAGDRPDSEGIEAAGIEAGRAFARRADLTLLVLDRSRPLSVGDRNLVEAHAGALLVANQSDLPAAWAEADLGAVAVSAERGDGLAGLLGRIADRLVPTAPPPGSAVPFLAEHVAELHRRASL